MTQIIPFSFSQHLQKVVWLQVCTLLGCVLCILTSLTSEIVLRSFRNSGKAPTWKGLCHGNSYSVLVKQRAQDLHFAMFKQSLVSLETAA